MNQHVFECPNHPGESITNYCCLRTCLTPLCPDCIDSHNKLHKARGQFPEMDTMGRVKKMCHDKLSGGIEQLQAQLDRLNSATSVNLEDIIKLSLQDLENLRDNLIGQINEYFQEIKEDYVQKIRASEVNFSDSDELKQKFSSVIEELNAVKYNLDTPSTFDSIRNTVKLDSEMLISAFDRQVEDVLSKHVSLPIKFVFSEEDLLNFQALLRKIVSVFSKDIKVITNEEYLKQMKNQSKTTEVETQNKSYFNYKFKNQ